MKLNLQTLKDWLNSLKQSKAFLAVNQSWLTLRSALNTSQHRVGCAADIRVPSMTPDEVVKAVIASGIGYDQIIREFDRWTHISVPNDPNGTPRKQALIIDKQGTRIYA